MNQPRIRDVTYGVLTLIECSIEDQRSQTTSALFRNQVGKKYIARTTACSDLRSWQETMLQLWAWERAASEYVRESWPKILAVQRGEMSDFRSWHRHMHRSVHLVCESFCSGRYWGGVASSGCACETWERANSVVGFGWKESKVACSFSKVGDKGDIPRSKFCKLCTKFWLSRRILWRLVRSRGTSELTVS